MVEVVIPECRLNQRRQSEVLLGNLILNELREALVPVVGKLVPLGVSWGSLTTFTAPNGDMVLRWEED